MQHINKCNQGRRTGFSLRKSLEDQGVTTEEAMREHIGFVGQMIQAGLVTDITRYRVDAANPNRIHHG